MAEPRPLPAALVSEPPLHESMLEGLLDHFTRIADETGSDLASVITDYHEDEDAGVELVDPANAEWALRHLTAAHATLETVQAQRDQWVREVDAWAEAESARARAGAAWFSHLLEQWGRARREADPKTATIHLPSGVIETTLRKPTARVVDDDALAEWAKANAPAAVVTVTTSKVPAAAAKELGTIHTAEDGTLMFVTADGEAVPGMAVEPARIDVRAKPVSGSNA